MRFVCFGYINETKWESLHEKEQLEILQDYFNFYQQLKRKNKFFGGIGLKSAKEACKLSSTGHEIKQSKLNLDLEQLGGFFYLEAENLEKAKIIVMRHPGLRVGSFEIRVVDEGITEIVGAK